MENNLSKISDSCYLTKHMAGFSCSKIIYEVLKQHLPRNHTIYAKANSLRCSQGMVNLARANKSQTLIVNVQEGPLFCLLLFAAPEVFDVLFGMVISIWQICLVFDCLSIGTGHLRCALVSCPLPGQDRFRAKSLKKRRRKKDNYNNI